MTGQGPEPFDLPRAVALALVVALHLLLLWLFLTVTDVIPAPELNFHEKPITVWLQTPKPKTRQPTPEPEKKTEEQKPVLAPPVEQSHGITVPPSLSAPKPPPPINGLNDLGRYLQNCSGMNYEQLTRKELAHCMGNQWDYQKNEGKGLRLGTQAPSQWKDQMEERKRPARQLEKPCPQGAPNSNLGLPCNNFDGAH